MHCLGCPASRGETVEQACAVHGVNVEELLAKVNEVIAAGN
jgi:hybrid cluster-associated redox disulfide protein